LNTQKDSENISQQLLQAHQSGTPVRLDCELSVQETYTVQSLVGSELDPKPMNWKTGLLSDGSVFCAPIAASHCQSSPADFSRRVFNALHVEAELAYRFHSGFDANKTHKEEDVFAAIDRVAVAIEVLDSRLENWQEAGELLHLADNQMNGGLVIGSGIENWQGIEPGTQAIRLLINDKLVVADSGSHPQLDPTSLLAHFVNQACQLGYTLPPGTWVTTGTWSDYPRAEPGDRVQVEFPGIGEASLVF